MRVAGTALAGEQCFVKQAFGNLAVRWRFGDLRMVR